MKGGACFRYGLAALLLLTLEATRVMGAPFALNPNIQLRLIMNTVDASGSASIRIAKDPRTNDLYYSKFNGDIYRVTVRPGSGTSTSTKVYGAANHGIADSAQGMAIGPDGTIYLVGNFTTGDLNRTYARIVKGVSGGTGERVWSVLAQTEAYPRSRTAFDHVFNGIIVSSDGNSIFVNSGSRTDHGEVQDVGGTFPNTREVGLTAKILRLPANASNLFLPNDINALRSAGYVFAEGTRNSFDFAFAPNGDLFGTENGPDRDMSDELNWLRAGLHFGFPWRIGGTDNPQQFPNYNPANDRLLDPRFVGVGGGYYHNDPTFPPRPANLAEPVINVGPDADKFRDPDTGAIRDASDLGLTLGTFTAHRSPLGLVFDTVGAMDLPFRNRGFMLSFTTGDPNGTSVAGPFFDASQDLVELECTKLGNTNYQARVTKLAGGFANPIDAEIIGNRIYVLEYTGQQGIWEITFPPTRTSVTLRTPAFQNGSFEFTIAGSIPGLQYEIQASTDLVHWTTVTNVIANSNAFKFRHTSAVPYRFYRAFQPSGSGSGLPAGVTNQDIGSVGIAGSTTYDQGVYTVNGSGNDIWGTADAFQFAYQTINGNGELVARVNSLQPTSPWAKAGVMFRQSTSANAANAFMMITPGQGTGFQWRSSAGGASNYVPGPALAAPAWVRLRRQGDLFTGYTSTDGLSWTIVGSQTIPMSGSILAGIGVTSHNNTTLNTGTFQNVTFTAQP